MMWDDGSQQTTSTRRHVRSLMIGVQYRHSVRIITQLPATFSPIFILLGRVPVGEAKKRPNAEVGKRLPRFRKRAIGIYAISGARGLRGA